MSSVEPATCNPELKFNDPWPSPSCLHWKNLLSWRGRKVQWIASKIYKHTVHGPSIQYGMDTEASPLSSRVPGGLWQVPVRLGSPDGQWGYRTLLLQTQERGWNWSFPLTSYPFLFMVGFVDRPEMCCEKCQMWAQVQGATGGSPEMHHSLYKSVQGKGRLFLTIKFMMRAGDGVRSLLVLSPLGQLVSLCLRLFLKVKHLVPQSGSLLSC